MPFPRRHVTNVAFGIALGGERDSVVVGLNIAPEDWSIPWEKRLSESEYAWHFSCQPRAERVDALCGHTCPSGGQKYALICNRRTMNFRRGNASTVSGPGPDSSKRCADRRAHLAAPASSHKRDARQSDHAQG